jgi:hypothetical protein
MSDHTTFDASNEATGNVAANTAARSKTHASAPARPLPFMRESQADAPSYGQPQPFTQPVSASGGGKSSAWKAYLTGAVVAGLVMVLFYQQSQISTLSRELGAVNDNVRSSDVRSRLDADDAKLQELNTRLSYMDSKITAVDQKAQISLDKWRAQEKKGNFITDILDNIGHSLGLK